MCYIAFVHHIKGANVFARQCKQEFTFFLSPYQFDHVFLLRLRWEEGVLISRPLLQTLADVYRVMSSGPTWRQTFCYSFSKSLLCLQYTITSTM